MNNIHLIYLNEEGQLIEDPEYNAVGLNGLQVEEADSGWLDLPMGADIMALPGRLPLGIHRQSGDLEVIEGATAVAAILPMGYTRTLLPGYETEHAGPLPLFGYTAVGWAAGQLRVAALKTDADLKWNPVYYNTSDLERLVREKVKAAPKNRILRQLGACALEYHCLTAQNIFYQRWEAGLPVSPVCNADCLGCISLQPSECCPSPQNRIDFIPEVREVVELAVAHLIQADEAIVSFGQGCEGEPALQQEVLVRSIKEIRRQTSKGTININSNAGYSEGIRRMVDAGLDSIRVSLFSAVPENYQWYHRPCGYGLEEVKQSLKYAVDHGVGTALNLLFFPGVTNQSRETEALYELIQWSGVHQIQLRNLNLDPEQLRLKLLPEEMNGVTEWLVELKKTFPTLLIGNYSIPRR